MQNSTGLINATAGAAIAANLRVKLSSGKLAVAVLADGPGTELGTLEQQVFADGDEATVRLRNVPGTRTMVAAKSFSAGAKVYTAAGGKISDTAATGSFLVGIALTASGADGDFVEVATDPGHVANA